MQRRIQVNEKRLVDKAEDPKDAELTHEEVKGGKAEGPIEGEKKMKSPRDVMTK